ncbi:hypothetical protein E2542_SST29697 [Spatholobus suberectus]|nr:hypothetical protein E2542_SST29697 [Spatholobus suberectus]
MTLSCRKKEDLTILVGLFVLTLLQDRKLIFAYCFYFLIGPHFCLLNMIGRKWDKNVIPNSFATDDSIYCKDLQFFVCSHLIDRVLFCFRLLYVLKNGFGHLGGVD